MFINGVYDPFASLLNRYDLLRMHSPVLGPGGIPIYGPVASTGLPAPGATRTDGTPFYNQNGQPIDRFGNLCQGGVLSDELW